MENLELFVLSKSHPVNLFREWSTEKFEKSLRTDEYGVTHSNHSENMLKLMLNVLEPFGELGHFYDICLEQLIKIKNDESNNK